MDNFILIATVIAGVLLLFFISLWVHAFIARAFGAETGTKTRVLMAGILTNIALFVIWLVLSNTLLPDLNNLLQDPDNLENSKLIFYGAIFLCLLLMTVIFSLSVRLGIIKSFITLIVGALATALFTLGIVLGFGLLGINQEKVLMAFQPEPETEQQDTSTDTSSPVVAETNGKSKIHSYLGSHQSKRIAIQQMAQNVCGCANEPECVTDTLETYQMFAERHKKSYPGDQANLLDELNKKAAFCAGDLNPELSIATPVATNANLEIAIREYHDELSKWAGTYRMTDISKQQNRRQKDGTYTAHVSYKYTPTEKSNQKSDGVDNRTFDYSKDEEGNYSVSAMGKQDSARLINSGTEDAAKWRAVSIGSLNSYDGVRLKVTRIVGEPLEGNLIGLTNTHVIVYIRRRDGEIGYEIERDNIAGIEAWY